MLVPQNIVMNMNNVMLEKVVKMLIDSSHLDNDFEYLKRIWISTVFSTYD